MAGFFCGLGRGTTSILTKPMLGVFDLAKCTSSKSGLSFLSFVPLAQLSQKLESQFGVLILVCLKK